MCVVEMKCLDCKGLRKIIYKNIMRKNGFNEDEILCYDGMRNNKVNAMIVMWRDNM